MNIRKIISIVLILIAVFCISCGKKNVIYESFTKAKEVGEYQVYELSYMGLTVNNESLDKIFKLINMEIGNLTLNPDKSGYISFNGISADISWDSDTKIIELKTLNENSKYTFENDKLKFKIKGVEVTYKKK